MIFDSQVKKLSSGDFGTTALEVLDFLHQRLGFQLWMVTRTEGDDWIVLQAKDKGYGVHAGNVFRWADSFCSEMVQGRGPRIAPRSDLVPAYANAPIGTQVNIGAYVGVPLLHSDGSLFGTLCAIDPIPQPETIAVELPLIELFAQLLSNLLDAELKLQEQIRNTERAEFECFTDHLTGLYNRRGWDKFLAAEEYRCSLYGHPAAIISLDLDNLKQINDSEGHESGDQLIRKTAQVLMASLRKQDVIARVGGDEFVIICVECDLARTETLIERLCKEMMENNVQASLGYALRNPSLGLKEAWIEADTSMYACKKSRKQSLIKKQ